MAPTPKYTSANERTRPIPNADERADEIDRIRKRAYELWEQEGSPAGRHDDHWLQAEREINHGGDVIEGDDLPRLDALREAARQHTDTFLVETDLEDADQREATPGVREQP